MRLRLNQVERSHQLIAALAAVLIALSCADVSTVLARVRTRVPRPIAVSSTSPRPASPLPPRAMVHPVATWPVVMAVLLGRGRSAIELLRPGQRPHIVFRAPLESPVKDAVWTADHRSVLFIETTLCHGDSWPWSTIWRLNPATGKVRRLLVGDCRDEYADLATSPDGKWMIFEAITGAYQISALVLARTDGHGARPLLRQSPPSFGGPPLAGDFHASFAPDSQHLVFARVNRLDGGGGLFVAALRSRHASQILALPSSCLINAAPSWAPDGTHIAYVDQPDGPPDGDVYVASPSGGDRRRLTFTARRPPLSESRTQRCYRLWPWMNPSRVYGNVTNGWPAWSPDGKTVLFGSTRNHREDCLGAFELFAVSATGGDARQLTRVPHSGPPTPQCPVAASDESANWT